MHVPLRAYVHAQESIMYCVLRVYCIPFQRSAVRSTAGVPKYRPRPIVMSRAGRCERINFTE